MSKNRIIIFLVIFSILGLYLWKSRVDRQLPTGSISQDLELTPSIVVTPAPIPGFPKVEIKTTKGTFTVELRPDLAPQSVVNFLTKWSNGYCNDLTFHRVEDWVIQGCDPAGTGSGGQLTLPTETSPATFTAGSVGVARLAYPKDKSNDSQFFIVKKDSTFLDGEYTYLGKVISGLSIITEMTSSDKILTTNILTK